MGDHVDLGGLLRAVDSLERFIHLYVNVLDARKMGKKELGCLCFSSTNNGMKVHSLSYLTPFMLHSRNIKINTRLSVTDKTANSSRSHLLFLDSKSPRLHPNCSLDPISFFHRPSSSLGLRSRLPQTTAMNYCLTPE